MHNGRLDHRGEHMKKEEALAAIKTLRDKINNQAEGFMPNEVLMHMDRAADVLEFPLRVIPFPQKKMN